MGNEYDDLLELLGAAVVGAAVGIGVIALMEALKKAKEEEDRRKGFGF